MGDQYGFHFDAKLCTGCKTCMLACKDYCNLDSASAYRQVYEMQGGGWTVLPDGTLQQDCFAYYVSLACNHCTNPACVANCPPASGETDPNLAVTLPACAEGRDVAGRVSIANLREIV